MGKIHLYVSNSVLIVWKPKIAAKSVQGLGHGSYWISYEMKIFGNEFTFFLGLSTC